MGTGYRTTSLITMILYMYSTVVQYIQSLVYIFSLLSRYRTVLYVTGTVVDLVWTLLGLLDPDLEYP
jgi:hypothetical protein